MQVATVHYGWVLLFGNIWISRPYLDLHKGTFWVSITGAGLAAVVEDFGLTFPCLAATTKQRYGVASAGEDDYIIWDIARGGFIITGG